MVARAIALLEKRGLLDDTIVVVTSDHGMPYFPGARRRCMMTDRVFSLAIRWPKGINDPGRSVDDPVI